MILYDIAGGEDGSELLVSGPGTERDHQARNHPLVQLRRHLDLLEAALDLSVLRRTEPAARPAQLSFEGLLIDTLRRTVTADGSALELTSMEYELLALLASNPGRDFSRDEILGALRGIDAALLTRSVSEMRRLGVACGAQTETFTGLSGLAIRLSASPPYSTISGRLLS
mgnify:CR=1 FL=1